MELKAITLATGTFIQACVESHPKHFTTHITVMFIIGAICLVTIKYNTTAKTPFIMKLMTNTYIVVKPCPQVHASALYHYGNNKTISFLLNKVISMVHNIRNLHTFHILSRFF